MTQKETHSKRALVIIIAYPFVILLMSIVVNLAAFDVKPPIMALPALGHIYPLIIAAVLLVINHTWLMTATELARARYKIYATPEEWITNGRKREDVSKEGIRALERCHNTHRNTTENLVYFIFLAPIFVLISPSILAAEVWIIGFAAARLGYTYSYLSGNDNMRGLFMSLSLLGLYGMTSYLLISLVV